MTRVELDEAVRVESIARSCLGGLRDFAASVVKRFGIG